MFKVFKYRKDYDLYCGVISSVEAKTANIHTSGMELANITKLRKLVADYGNVAAFGGDTVLCKEGKFDFNYSTGKYTKAD